MKLLFPSLLHLLTILPVYLVSGSHYIHPRYQNARLLRSDSVNHEDGNYRWSYAVSDGTTNQQRGYVKYVGGRPTQAVEGSYAYISPEGIPVSLSYRADEGGFRAVYNNVPQSPPLPKEIQESLALQWKNAQEQLIRSGSTVPVDALFPQLTQQHKRVTPSFSVPVRPSRPLVSLLSSDPDDANNDDSDSDHDHAASIGSPIKKPSRWPIVAVTDSDLPKNLRVPTKVADNGSRDYETIRVIHLPVSRPNSRGSVRRTVIRRRLNPGRGQVNGGRNPSSNSIRIIDRDNFDPPKYYGNDRYFLSSRPFESYNDYYGFT